MVTVEKECKPWGRNEVGATMSEAKLTSSQAFPRVVPPSFANILWNILWNIVWKCDEEIEHTLGVKNSSKWCSYSVRETHTLFSNEKNRNIWKFVILKIKFTDRSFNGTKIKLNLFERTSEHQLFSLSTLFDLQRVSQSLQHYNSAIPDNTPGFI